MALESVQDRIHSDQYPDGSVGGAYQSAKYVFATVSMTLASNQVVCECVTGGAVDVTITLPNVEEAAGKIYSISLITDGGFDVVVQDQDESRDWEGDFTMDTALDYVLLYSDGRKWFVLNSEVA